MKSNANEDSDLQRLRGQIDAIDDQIIDLLRKRIELSTSIIKTKQSTKVVDVEREREILGRYLAKLSEVSTEAKLRQLVSGILSASKSYP